MKKTLIALAALAVVGTASAQSSVTLSGIAKVGFAQTEYTGAVAGNGNGSAIADGSSRFIIGGTEDLGGGLKAVFQIDNRFRFDDNGAAPTSSPLATGNSFVGLSGGFGMVQLGKLDTHYGLGADSHTSRATAHQASSISLLSYINGAPIAFASRSANVIRYTSPDFAGFKGQLNYSTNPFGSEGAVGTTGEGRAAHASLVYSQGPIKAGVSLWNANTESRVTGAARADQRAYTLMADYNFGMATVGLTYDDSRINAGLIGAVDAETVRRAWSIPVTVPMGAGTILFTYTKAEDSKLNGTSTANTGASLVSVGYDYALSKRTTVGVSYAKLDNKSAAGYNLFTQASGNGTPNNAVGQDVSQLYLGVRHAF